MRYAWRAAVCGWVLASLLSAETLTGVVRNGTNGKPAAGIEVTAVTMGEGGMRPAGSTRSGADGSFRLETPGGGAVLLQANYQGVTYSQVAAGGAPVELLVYEVSRDPSAARPSEHMILLEPAKGQLQVSEVFLFRNNSKTTFLDSRQGSVRFFLPQGAAADSVKVRIVSPGGMPVERAAQATPTPGVYRVDYPVKPGGETRFDIAYSLPAAEPLRFSGKVLYKETPTRIAVPSGVKLTGDNLMEMGQEPQSRAVIYEVTADTFDLLVEGTGTLSASSESEEETGNEIRQMAPRIYDRVEAVAGLSLAILMVGFWMLYRRRSPEQLAVDGTAAKGGRKP